jgi:cell division protein FtsQ
VRKNYSTNGQGATAIDDGLYGDEMLELEDERPRPLRRTRAGSRLEELNPRDLEIAEPMESREPVRGRRVTGKKKRLIPETTAGRIVLGASLVLALATLGAAGYMVREFFRLDPRFRVASSEQITVQGTKHVTADEVRDAFGEDMGRNLFFIPLRARQKELETLPWVEHATVERLLPDRIAVVVRERTPVAFVQDGNRIRLIDRFGVLLDPSRGPETQHYSFPVLQGVGEDVAPSTRLARMQLYEKFLGDVDSGGEKVSPRLSEVDVSDPEDLVAVIPESGAAYLVHFGDEKFQERYKTYAAHLAEWKGQYPRLASVDLRNAPQVVLGMSKVKAVDLANAGAVAAPIEKPDVVAKKPPPPVTPNKAIAKKKNSAKPAKASATAPKAAIASAAPVTVHSPTVVAPASATKPGMHLHAASTGATASGGQP